MFSLLRLVSFLVDTNRLSQIDVPIFNREESSVSTVCGGTFESDEGSKKRVICLRMLMLLHFCDAFRR